MVRLDKQRCRVWERLVPCEPARLSVTMGRNDRQVTNSVIQLHGYSACCRLGRKEPVFIQHENPTPLRMAQGHTRSVETAPVRDTRRCTVSQQVEGRVCDEVRQNLRNTVPK